MFWNFCFFIGIDLPVHRGDEGDTLRGEGEDSWTEGVLAVLPLPS